MSAPRAIKNGRKDGEVYKCLEEKSCLIISRDSARAGNLKGVYIIYPLTIPRVRYNFEENFNFIKSVMLKVMFT